MQPYQYFLLTILNGGSNAKNIYILLEVAFSDLLVALSCMFFSHCQNIIPTVLTLVALNVVLTSQLKLTMQISLKLLIVLYYYVFQY